MLLSEIQRISKKRTLTMYYNKGQLIVSSFIVLNIIAEYNGNHKSFT